MASDNETDNYAAKRKRTLTFKAQLLKEGPNPTSTEQTGAQLSITKETQTTFSSKEAPTQLKRKHVATTKGKQKKKQMKRRSDTRDSVIELSSDPNSDSKTGGNSDSDRNDNGVNDSEGDKSTEHGEGRREEEKDAVGRFFFCQHAVNK